jgi:hypothetical protein
VVKLYSWSYSAKGESSGIKGEGMMIRYRRSYAAVALVIFFAATVATSRAQQIAAPVSSLRVYLFDCGLIKGEDPLTYGLKPGEVKNPDMVFIPREH